MSKDLKIILVEKGLSPREAETAILASRGFSNMSIAEQMGITLQTAKSYLTIVYKKLKLKNRSALIIWCLTEIGGQITQEVSDVKQ